jgi:predicted Ser/Thr protein kinase
MSEPTDTPPEVGSRWRDGVVLKRDVFSTIERGVFSTPEGDVSAILRRLDQVPWWSKPLARHLFARERKALAIAGELGIAPRLLFAGKDVLVRSFIDGVPLYMAKPVGDVDYFRAGRAALRRLHRALITHNDLNKPQNWLRGADGKPYLTDFQLAMVYRRRSKRFRLMAYEDLRVFLKHKRKYVPDALTATEKRLLSRKSLPSRIWMATGKRLYRLITRGLFGFVDREGGGTRLAHDAPRMVAALTADPQVQGAAVVAYPDNRMNTGLYAFVETKGLSDADAGKLLAALDIRMPEHIQVVEALPRDAAGDVRTEILQLIAMNQLDQLTPLINTPAELTIVARIIANRKNLKDRVSA